MIYNLVKFDYKVFFIHFLILIQFFQNGNCCQNAILKSKCKFLIDKDMEMGIVGLK